jgi:hypothetical protein
MHRALEKCGYELSDSEFELLTRQFRATSTKRINFADFKRLILLFDKGRSQEVSPLLMRKRNEGVELPGGDVSFETTPQRFCSKCLGISRMLLGPSLCNYTHSLLKDRSTYAPCCDLVNGRQHL